MMVAVFAFAFHNIQLTWWMLPAALILGLLPDIDSTRSIIGRRAPRIATYLESTYGHRTITHSIWPIMIIFITCYWSSFFVKWTWWIPGAMYASHIVLDMIIGTTGVPLFWPEPTRFYLIKRFRAGSIAERIITIALIVTNLLIMGTGIPDLSAAMQRATGSLDYAVAQYREWQPYNNVAIQLEATDQLTNQPLVGTFPVERVTGKTFIINVNGVQREAGQADQELYIRHVVAQRGDPLKRVAPTFTPTPTPEPFVIKLSGIDIEHVLVSPGDQIQRGDILAMPPTPTPTATYDLVLVPTPRAPATETAWPTAPPSPTATATHALFRQHIQPLDDWTAYRDRVAQAQANMNLSAAQATAAAAPPSQQSIDAVCNRVDQLTSQLNIELGLAVIVSPTPDLASAQNRLNIARAKATRAAGPVPQATLETVCTVKSTNTAQQELNAATVALAAAQANYDIAAAPPSAQEITAACGGVTSTLAEQQRVTAAQAALDQLLAPVPVATVNANCDTLQLTQRRDQEQQMLDQLLAPVPAATLDANCDTLQLAQRRDQEQQALDQLLAPVPAATVDASCNMLQLTQRRDQEQQTLDQLLAPVPAATQESACFTLDLVARRDGAQVKLNNLRNPVPQSTRTACWSNVEARKNALWAAQLSRDAAIAAADDMPYNQQKALEAPLLERERVIAYETALCQEQDAITAIGSPDEVAAAESDLLIAQSALDRQNSECSTWSIRSHVGNEWQIDQARTNLQIAQSALDSQAQQCNTWSSRATVGDSWQIDQAKTNLQIAQSALDSQAQQCNTWSSRATVGDEWQIEQAKTNLQIAQSALDSQAQQCHSISTLATVGDGQQIAAARASLESAKIALSTARQNITQQSAKCQAISTKQHSVSDAELIAINASLQAAVGRLSAAQSRYDNLVATNAENALTCQDLSARPHAVDAQELELIRMELQSSELAYQSELNAHELQILNSQNRTNERNTRIEQLQLDIQNQHKLCHEITNQQHVRDGSAMQVAQAQYDLAVQRYQSTLYTPTPVPTWTPIPTWSATPLPSDTPTVTPTPSPTPDFIPTPDDNAIRSQIAGTIQEIRLAGISGNDATVEILVIPEALPGLGSVMPRKGATQSSGNISVFFTKNGIDVEQELIAHIDAAREIIDIASFEFNLPAVADALIRAQARGIPIRFITDNEYGLHHDDAKLFPRMQAAGVQIRDDDRSALMHNKFWIFDRQIVWTGSTNITTNGTQKNNNNVVIFNSPAVAAIYQTEFAEMWHGDYGITSTSQLANQRATLGGSSETSTVSSVEPLAGSPEPVEGSTEVEILFGPEDDAMDRLIELVSSAQQSVRFMAFSFTHDQLGQAMLDAATSTGNVQGIFEARGAGTEYSELTRLHCQSPAQVRTDGNSRTFHHKVLIIDDEIVVTGSFNFSKNANTKNDENAIVIHSSEIAAAYNGEFDRRWVEGKESDVSCN